MKIEEFKALIYPLTSQEVAEMSGYSFRTVQGWLTGRPVPPSFIVAHSRRKVLIYYKYRGSDFTRRRVKRDFKSGNKLALVLYKELL
jgi:hypothetical protein